MVTEPLTKEVHLTFAQYAFGKMMYILCSKKYIKLEKLIPFIINDDDYNGDDILDIKSSANHLLTLRQGRENYKKIGACCKEELQYCRKPKKSEMV